VAIPAVAVGFTAVATACGAAASAGLLDGAEAGWPALVFDVGASVVAAAGGSAFDAASVVAAADGSAFAVASVVVAADGAPFCAVASFVAAADGSAFLALVVQPELTRIASTKQPNVLCMSFI
jgi:hypothetical protein